MDDMDAESMDFSVFSPPFPSLYAYTSDPADIGNVDRLDDEAKIHLSFFFHRLRKIMKSGRVIICHVAQVPRMKRASGVGLHDFRGMVIRIAERAGLIYEYDWVVRKNPQAQAIRNRARELQFSGLESDRANSRGCLPDYLIKLRVPGVNEIPIDSRGEVSRNEWIEWAECTWSVRETNTLNVSEGRGEDDTKHICPLQLDVINRCVKLYSNPGETVFSPFTGIGSEGYASLLLGRKFYGCELKDEYFKAACKNMERAEQSQSLECSLFA